MNTRINRERIKILRLGKAWTQQRLAEEAGLSLRSMQRIEQEGTASLQSRSAIAAAFGIEPIELEVDEIRTNSSIEILLILVVLTYCSFYFALEIFEISVEPLSLWSIPLIPSITILIFGLVLHTNFTSAKRHIVAVFASIILAQLVSPPEPTKQFAFTIALWITFETLRILIPTISQMNRFSNSLNRWS